MRSLFSIPVPIPAILVVLGGMTLALPDVSAAGHATAGDAMSVAFPHAAARGPDALLAGTADPNAGSDAALLQAPSPVGADEAKGLSRRRALFLSLLLPGLGHGYAGHENRAKLFYTIEGGIWSAFTVFRVQGHLRRDDYIEHAKVYAGVATEDETDEYYRLVAVFPRSDPGPGSYNEQIRIEARSLFPGDRSAQDAYVADHGYFGDRAWSWQTREQQLEYRDIRSSSLDAYDRSTYMIAAAVLNRLVSAVDAVRLTAKGQRESREEGGLGIHFEGGGELRAQVAYTRAF